MAVAGNDAGSPRCADREAEGDCPSGKEQVVEYLRSGSFNSRRLADIVNYIRMNP